MTHLILPWTQLGWGALFALIIAACALRAHALTRDGAIASWLVGALIFGFGGLRAASALIAFFVTSTLLSRWRKHTKEALGFEKTGRRDAGQVWANGGIAAWIALASGFVSGPKWHAALVIAFLAAIAEANADTWATEIGSLLGGRPYVITTGRVASAGTSGAVSVIGTVAALIGSLVIGLFALPEGVLAVAWVTASGLFGALSDSVLGATVQAQWHDPAQPDRWTERPIRGVSPEKGYLWFNNDRVNLLATLFAACSAGFLASR